MWGGSVTPRSTVRIRQECGVAVLKSWGMRVMFGKDADGVWKVYGSYGCGLPHYLECFKVNHEPSLSCSLGIDCSFRKLFWYSRDFKEQQDLTSRHMLLSTSDSMCSEEFLPSARYLLHALQTTPCQCRCPCPWVSPSNICATMASSPLPQALSRHCGTARGSLQNSMVDACDMKGIMIAVVETH
jgi:hypothetical protein